MENDIPNINNYYILLTLPEFPFSVIPACLCPMFGYPESFREDSRRALLAGMTTINRYSKNRPPAISAARFFTISLILIAFCFFAGCASNIDKQKFSGIKAAAREIDKAVGDTSLSYSQFKGLLDKLTDEIARAKAGVSTAEERSLLNSCQELLAIYRDGSTLWEYKVDSSQYGWIPRGRIYMDAKIRTIAVKYQLPAEAHVNELTNHHWESLSTESIRTIWDKAHDKLKKINF